MKIAITVSEQGELLLGYHWHIEDDQGEPLSARKGPYLTWGKCLDELHKEWPEIVGYEQTSIPPE